MTASRPHDPCDNPRPHDVAREPRGARAVGALTVGRATFLLIEAWRRDASGLVVSRWFVRLDVPGCESVRSGVHDSREQAAATFHAWAGSVWSLAAALPMDEGREVF